jgi:hypothetical protein
MQKKKKFSMIKSAQTKLKNQKDSKGLSIQ